MIHSIWAIFHRFCHMPLKPMELVLFNIGREKSQLFDSAYGQPLGVPEDLSVKSTIKAEALFESAAADEFAEHCAL